MRMNESTFLWHAGDEPDWTTKPKPYDVMHACPTCGRHMRLVARRYRDPMMVAYWADCPNQCEARAVNGIPPLSAATPAKPGGRVSCGRVRDVDAAIDAWNTRAGDAPILQSGRIWPDAVACPVCHREYLPDDVFDAPGGMRLGCPHHPLVASVAAGDEWKRDRRMLLLADHISRWEAWARNHRCPLCGRDAALTVTDEGAWACRCACDDTSTAPHGVPVTIIGELAIRDGDTPLDAIREWNERVDMRRGIVARRQEKRGRALRDLEELGRELADLDDDE